MPEVDYIIVGLGIAGSLLSHKLISKGYSIIVFDDDNPNAASKISSGIINPVTGRRLVKSWMYEQLKEVFTKTYASIEESYQIQIIEPTLIHRTSTSIKDDNLVRTVALNESEYCKMDLTDKAWQGRVNNYISFGGISGYKVNVPNLLECIKKRIMSTHTLINEDFDHTQIEFDHDMVTYRNTRAKKIIFCEGWKGIHNPYFDFVNLDPAKGEVLKVDIPKPTIKDILKHKLFIVPQSDGLYWVGSTYDWKQYDESPTQNKLDYLRETLTYILKEDFTIVDHLAGIRPTTTDRRPIVQIHPKHSSLAIFNGLGTKGASIAPYFAKRLCDLLSSSDSRH